MSSSDSISPNPDCKPPPVDSAVQEPDNWRENYNKYLLSNKWHSKRKEFLCGWSLCLGCLGTFTASRLHLHHINYKSLGEETKEDVLPLCKTCHDLLHDFLRSNGWLVNRSKKAWKQVFNRPFQKNSGWLSSSETRNKPPKQSNQKKRKKHRLSRSQKKKQARKQKKKKIKGGWKAVVHDPEFVPIEKTSKFSEPIRVTDSPSIVQLKLNYRRSMKTVQTAQ